MIFQSILTRLRIRMRKILVLSGVKTDSNEKMERLGTGNGAWVVPISLIDENSICYCVGCGEDISFDLELIKRFNCEVFSFDPTPKAIQHIKSMYTEVNNQLSDQSSPKKSTNYDILPSELAHF